MPLQQAAFSKRSDKRRNCSKQAISPFATMFSTFSHRLSVQLKRFSIFWQNMLKVVCCRIIVWGKGLNNKNFWGWHINSVELSCFKNLILLWASDVVCFLHFCRGLFWKHCDKRRSCSWWAISPFAKMFSTLFKQWNYKLKTYALSCWDDF